MAYDFIVDLLIVGDTSKKGGWCTCILWLGWECLFDIWKILFAKLTLAEIVLPQSTKAQYYTKNRTIQSVRNYKPNKGLFRIEFRIKEKYFKKPVSFEVFCVHCQFLLRSSNMKTKYSTRFKFEARYLTLLPCIILYCVFLEKTLTECLFIL